MVTLYIHVRVPEQVAQALADGVELFCRANNGELIAVTSPSAPPGAPNCPACAKPMMWDATLEAWSCPHVESGEATDLPGGVVG